MKSDLPIPFSYQVTENFFAGEYPFEKVREEGLTKLQKLIDFGIKFFIDLTEERQFLTEYREFLPPDCTYLNLPTEDNTSPDFQDLKTAHDIISQSDGKVYVHCKGGYDRTGVVVATYFIYLGKTSDEAKELYLQKADKIRKRYPHKPLIETKWKILELYREWLAQANTSS